MPFVIETQSCLLLAMKQIISKVIRDWKSIKYFSDLFCFTILRSMLNCFACIHMMFNGYTHCFVFAAGLILLWLHNLECSWSMTLTSLYESEPVNLISQWIFSPQATVFDRHLCILLQFITWSSFPTWPPCLKFCIPHFIVCRDLLLHTGNSSEMCQLMVHITLSSEVFLLRNLYKCCKFLSIQH